MSLINRVLQDLEARRGAIEGRPFPDEVRALPPQRRRGAWLWLLPALVGCIALAVYLAWPEVPPPAVVLSPHPVVMPEPVVAAPVPLPAPLTPTTVPGGGSGSAPPAAPVRGEKSAIAEQRLSRPLRSSAAPADIPVVINKEVHSPTAHELANGEYVKAIGLLSQGRAEQGAAALRAAIREEPAWAAPRQALLGLLLEQGRADEAEALLRQGVAQNPTQIDLPIQLARLQVERRDFNGALETLQRAAPAAPNADYLGLHAAVLQRLGRHREAAAAYEAGLRLAPQNGVWWMGLGISLEAEGRSADAAEAYRRARDSGTLSAELMNFVEGKLQAAARPK